MRVLYLFYVPEILNELWLVMHVKFLWNVFMRELTTWETCTSNIQAEYESPFVLLPEPETSNN